ncbi:MAG: valine--tRNA ligase [Planctomycetota bacterium]|nr:MAG: valine--tRNA ligase [Planctomycetota bacterium]
MTSKPIELQSRYEPREIEARIWQAWERSGAFHAEPDDPRPPYTIVIPPPNVTGVLHLGHALNNTLQDVLIRYHRMRGDNARWVPGTDHAGIATQNVVERMLRKEEGKTRHDLGREAFLERVWAWKEKNGSRIIEQLKRLGASCDWERERFTMDEGLSRAVREVFCRLYEDGLIYRGEYLVNWCPRCETALSDEEAIPTERKGKLYRIRYPVVGEEGACVVVATTRPETMLGDTAVAVHPDDERYRHWIGKRVRLPLVGREIPVIADTYVDREFGTGCLKITPAHDLNDFEVGERHGLERVNVMTPDGRINERGGPYAGLDRFEARKRIVADLEAQGLLEGIDPHPHKVPCCERCDTVLEYYLSEQWFVRMAPLAEKAIEVVERGEVRFHPERWTSVYLHWMRNIRDWCISRQLWWGHRIPVWYCGGCGAEICAREEPKSCPQCGSSDLEQDPDVLDTWFSSWLWPLSTLGWPDDTADLRTFYPTNTLVTGHEIIFFWVARMIMAGLYCKGEIPFRDVVIHGIVRDERGRKMSKSLGNGIDPIEVIEKTSADALRFTLLYLTPEGQDTRVSMKRFEIGRNFCTKLWNAARLILGNLEGYEGAQPLEQLALAPEDRWLLSRLHATIETVSGELDALRFHAPTHALYDFTWGALCDWWLEIAKPRLHSDDPAERAVAQQVAVHVLEQVLKLLHPSIPFITEELWGRLGAATGAHDRPLLITAPWPEAQRRWIDPEVEAQFGLLTGLVRALRNVRARYRIAPTEPITALVTGAAGADAHEQLGIVQRSEALVRRLARLGSLEIGPGIERPRACATEVVRDLEVYVPLEGLIDLAAERERLEGQLAHKRKQLEGVRRKLANPAYVERAPAEVVAQTREREAELEREIAALEAGIADLGAGAGTAEASA